MINNKIDLEKFNELRDLTKASYEKISKIHCPALKSDISFTSDGFHHLRYDNTRNKRDKKAQYNKFIYFNSAVDTLKKSTTLQEYRRSICPIGKADKNGLRKTKIVEWFGFLSIISFAKAIRINVVVRRIGGDNGQLHFWSVMPYWKLSNNKRVVGSKKMEDE